MLRLLRSPQDIRTLSPPSQTARARNVKTKCADDRLSGLSGRFAQALAALDFDRPECAAIAVSGGGDSLALMHLFAEWAKARNLPYPVVLIVDHGLRDESAKEVEDVALSARAAGFAASVLTCKGERPTSDIEAKARAGRYRAIGEWSLSHGIEKIFLGHTREDQAETFLLRLGRGSGVDGLSAMKPSAEFPLPGFPKLRLARPLLEFGRDELRGYLRSRNVAWWEDVMNSDARFSRVRVRKALGILAEAGISVPRVAEAARHIMRAREALEAATENFLSRFAHFDGTGQARLDGAELGRIPREIALRAVSATLMRVGGAVYRPRFERLSSLLDAILAGDRTGRTLHGCRIGRARKAGALFGPATLIVTREQARRRQ